MNTKNNLAVAGLILGIFGILLTVYLAKEKKREPVYSVIKTPSLIFDRFNASSNIKLIVNDSLLLSENVYITTLVVWNKGKLPITKEDIREDLFIYCSDSTSKMLEFNIMEENESGVSNFKLIPKNDSLQIGWDYFDPGFGFKIQVIYTGNDTTKIVVSGKVLGSKVKQVTTKEKGSLSPFTLFLIIVLVYSLLIFQIWTFIDLLKRANTELVIGIILTFIGVLFLVAILYKTIHSIFAINPPF